MLAPVAGGLLVGLIVHYFIGVERYHGVAGIIESVALSGGRLRYWRVSAKTIASAISIGGRVGRTGRSVRADRRKSWFYGWAVAAIFRRADACLGGCPAQRLVYRQHSTRRLPVSFSRSEIILGEISGGALGVVVLASVVSAVVIQAISGPQPAFSIPAYEFQSALELPFYLVLGLLAGPTAAFYGYLLNVAQDLFHGLSAPRWVKPVIAGAMVGFVGIFLPQVMGVGYPTIEQILNGQHFALWLLLALTLAKLVCTPISIGGGFLGGVFAPSLFIGATLGDAFGTVAEWLFPTLGITPPSFAMVGMAAVLAGAVHAPLTSIILLFEMTNDYRIILPLMFAVTVSLLLSQRLQRDSVYMIGLCGKGIRIERGRDVEVLESLTVGEVMETDVASVLEVDSLDTATNLLTKMHSHGLPVVDSSGELVGIVTVQILNATVPTTTSSQPLPISAPVRCWSPIQMNRWAKRCVA